MGMKKFEVLKMITDEKKFSELIFDLSIDFFHIVTSLS